MTVVFPTAAGTNRFLSDEAMSPSLIPISAWSNIVLRFSSSGIQMTRSTTAPVADPRPCDLDLLQSFDERQLAKHEKSGENSKQIEGN
ncbi:MAG: hypothetical protein EOS26_00495 [Mesorhizobium sp.]|nr:MAG: hypothetical protein EOS26_00495 [Mesorhizobium sp.]